jgi:hypothetical protein
MERLMVHENGRRFCQVYLSLLGVECNSIYASYGSRQISLYLLNPFKTIVVRDDADGIHEEWLESMKKHSSLISGSNELLLSEFIDRQRGVIENIGGAF